MIGEGTTFYREKFTRVNIFFQLHSRIGIILSLCKTFHSLLSTMLLERTIGDSDQSDEKWILRLSLDRYVNLSVLHPLFNDIHERGNWISTSVLRFKYGSPNILPAFRCVSSLVFAHDRSFFAKFNSLVLFYTEQCYDKCKRVYIFYKRGEREYEIYTLGRQTHLNLKRIWKECKCGAESLEYLRA